MKLVKVVAFTVLTTAIAIFIIRRVGPLNNLVFGSSGDSAK